MTTSQNTYTAFEGLKILAQGDLSEVVLKVKRKLGKEANNNDILIFSDSTGRSMDFNFQGNESDVLKRLEVFTQERSSKTESGPGRPKLGVISREVSLLPRHWEWLANQPMGASAALRQLVEEGIKKSSGGSELKAAQERTYKFMSALAGDLPGYEEALRALYKKDKAVFSDCIQHWPADIKMHTQHLAKPVFIK